MANDQQCHCQGSRFVPVKQDFCGVFLSNAVTAYHLGLLWSVLSPAHPLWMSASYAKHSVRSETHEATTRRDSGNWLTAEWSGLLSEVPSSSSLCFYMGRGRSVGPAGEAGSTIKLNNVPDIYLRQWTCFVHASKQISFSSGFHRSNLSRWHEEYWWQSKWN